MFAQVILACARLLTTMHILHSPSGCFIQWFQKVQMLKLFYVKDKTSTIFSYIVYFSPLHHLSFFFPFFIPRNVFSCESKHSVWKSSSAMRRLGEIKYCSLSLSGLIDVVYDCVFFLCCLCSAWDPSIICHHLHDDRLLHFLQYKYMSLSLLLKMGVGKWM